MLKQAVAEIQAVEEAQPPSGGCVLKHKTPLGVRMRYFPAAFGRLCVETSQGSAIKEIDKPAAFGRLCVETILEQMGYGSQIASRLRAAVC